MEEDNIYIKHILGSISKIEKYIYKVRYEDFIKNPLLQDAVIRRLEIIGEATKRLSTELKEKNIKVPWKDIAIMRDILIHHYFDVDVDEVWLTIEDYIPLLKKELNKILKKEDIF